MDPPDDGAHAQLHHPFVSARPGPDARKKANTSFEMRTVSARAPQHAVAPTQTRPLRASARIFAGPYDFARARH